MEMWLVIDSNVANLQIYNPGKQESVRFGDNNREKFQDGDQKAWFSLVGFILFLLLLILNLIVHTTIIGSRFAAAIGSPVR
jgi:hypothetical protein